MSLLPGESIAKTGPIIQMIPVIKFTLLINNCQEKAAAAEKPPYEQEFVR